MRAEAQELRPIFFFMFASAEIHVMASNKRCSLEQTFGRFHLSVCLFMCYKFSCHTANNSLKIKISGSEEAVDACAHMGPWHKAELLLLLLTRWWHTSDGISNFYFRFDWFQLLGSNCFLHLLPCFRLT